MNISERDLTKLAILVNKTVQSADFPEDGKFEQYADKTRRLIRILERKYSGVSLLRSVRDAIDGIADDRIGFYAVARDLIRAINRKVRYRCLPTEEEYFDLHLPMMQPQPAVIAQSPALPGI